MDEEKKPQGSWYVIQTLSGKERKVRDSIERQLKTTDVLPVYAVCLPMETVSEVKQGRKKTVERLKYPGYVFVNMDLYEPETRELREEVWYFIRNTQGVISFRGGGTTPLALSEQELGSFPPPMGPSEAEVPQVTGVVWDVGSRAVITDGAFEGFEGVVSAVDADRQRVTIEVTIFDRKTPAELEFWQVEHAE